jgi:hypothetical protein
MTASQIYRRNGNETFFKSMKKLIHSGFFEALLAINESINENTNIQYREAIENIGAGYV